MKWTDKGCELDDVAEKVMQNFERNNRKVFLYGAGSIGNDIRLIIERYHIFGGFIDNNPEKQKKGYQGEKVMSLAQYLQRGERGWIVVSMTDSMAKEVIKELARADLGNGTDFFHYLEFMGRIFPILSFYQYGLLYVDTVQISLTERCTLRCKKCAHGCHMVPIDSQDMEIEDAHESADKFFATIDWVGEFTLIGGEPFLYQDLGEVIEYIGERYRSKAAIFSITSNGTIIPGQQVLDMCRKYDILVRISNYSGTLKFLENRYKRLQEVLEENHIRYVLGRRETQWMDYGFETVNHDGEEKELIRIFDECGTPCREIRGSKYYYCVMARSVSDNLKLGIGKEDYLDMNKLSGKKEFFEFNMGYSEKGYLDMCKHCNGKDAMQYPIPAAEQMDINNGISLKVDRDESISNVFAPVS